MMDMILKMVPAEKLSTMLKPHVPALLEQAQAAIAKAAGAPEGERVGVFLFTAGTVTMATVYPLNELNEPGEAIGTVSVQELIDGMDIGALTKGL